jgi:T5SS/PEP-CTERM-associated repeat protein
MIMKTKSASQTAAKPFWKNAILLAITVLALLASPGSRADSACQQSFTHWTGPSSEDWFNAFNWTNDSGQHVVPTCESPAEISNSSTVHIYSTTQTATSCELFLGNLSQQVGQLIVNSGTLNTCKELHVGYRGTGAMAIGSGGVISTTFAADIAAIAGSSGSVAVDGVSSKWEVYGGMYVGGTKSGPGGTGLLIVNNYGIVEALGAPNSPGVVHVYQSGTLAGDSGSSWVVATNGTTIEGTIAPPGGYNTLTIFGDLTIASNTVSSAPTMQCTVSDGDPTYTPQISVSGAASLGPGSRVSVTMTGTAFIPGTRYMLLHSDGSLNGTFSIHPITYDPNNQCFTPVITYDAHNVYLSLQTCSK